MGERGEERKFSYIATNLNYSINYYSLTKKGGSDPLDLPLQLPIQILGSYYYSRNCGSISSRLPVEFIV